MPALIYVDMLLTLDAIKFRNLKVCIVNVPAETGDRSSSLNLIA